MPQYTITLTEAQDKAFRHVVVDPQDWAENAVLNRARIAMEDIVQKEITRLRQEGQTVSGTDDEIVMSAQIKTLAEMEVERNTIPQISNQ